MKKSSNVILFQQLLVSIVQLSFIVLIVTIEIPTLNFQKISVFEHTEKIDYWKDLFYPPIDVPLNVIIFFFVTNTIFLLLLNKYFKQKRSIFMTGFWLCAFGNIVLFWACLLWVHNGLLCSVQVLANADLFFCFDVLPPLLWQTLIGLLFSVFIIFFYIFTNKKMEKLE